MRAEVKQFQYEVQAYQEDCVGNIISLFENFRDGVPFTKALQTHQETHLYNFPVQETRNIDVMMETGTGKTFTFIKTIFELSKNFGYKKFIILVPTVPIREGTKTNLEDTKTYFRSLYANERDKEIETFVYEGGNISAVRQFIMANHLSVLVMTPSSFNSSDNILNRPLDKEIHTPTLFESEQKSPKTYLECLKRLNPIIIMDEPHRFEGDAFKKYFEGFDNYYLRFGATFPKKKDSLSLSNVAYVLDSISSFRQSLVKKIVVYTQGIATGEDTLVGIETIQSKNTALVNTLINGISVRRKLVSGEVFNGKTIKKINKKNLILGDDTIVSPEYALSDEALRAMIKETIKIHFEKEKKLFEKGIKALTLFFMESNISAYRGDQPKIKIIFEEEYTRYRTQLLQSLDPDNPYYAYLQKDFDSEGKLQVHKGYFSGDKGSKDAKIKQGVDEILKDKKKLLSLDSPTRFIFSIWALQEGWDNPNVFTICKLSNEGSDISKLQQIGRGLRICVNQDLERQTLKNLGNDQELFWEINNLDVIVSDKEKGFVEGIQSEILSNSYLLAEVFTEQELKIRIKAKSNFDDSTIRNLFRAMEHTKMIIYKTMVDGIDVFEKSPDFLQILREQNLPDEQRRVLENIFATDAGAYIQKGKERSEKKKVFIKPTHLKEFQNLWNAIHKNTFYILETLNEAQEQQLISNIKQEIERLEVSSIRLQTVRAELNINQIGKSNAITEQITNTISYQNQVDYLELVRALSSSTKTPIAFVVKIFNALDKDFKSKIISNNPAQAQKEISEIIKKNLVAMLKANVRYDGISGTAMPNLFKTEQGKTYLDIGSTGKFQKTIEQDFPLKNKWVFEDVIEYDSDFELNLIQKDPDMNSIEIFGKLPRLKIKTPMGEYNPDFCYAVQSKEGKKVFLVVEAKGYQLSTEIPTDEKSKIDFARKYFEALSAYYKDQPIKISFKERISKTQFASLIED
ncbi:DEAD/DEAH box helicase family protein [Riemerella anatipestifer]|uniref:restriction endonuclease n=1 Tax=Riemerella anatipestifer TaxID=34085 RepID=UPI00129EEE4A|nr:DEAD/DEAH box helicase family protein [Riemerella anatipestifer]MRM83265.1 type III restriction endonuclease subunit R [Riemerella anatipestifer]